VQIPSPAQVAFSVSKKTFKKAATRNLIKRRMRESYRKMKHLLYNFLEAENKQLTFIIVYRGNTIIDFITMENAMKEILDKLSFLVSGTRQKS
jgi:ribonuclease P protein component